MFPVHIFLLLLFILSCAVHYDPVLCSVLSCCRM